MKLSSSTISRLARYISAAISGVLAARAISAGSSGLFSSRSSQPCTSRSLVSLATSPSIICRSRSSMWPSALAAPTMA